MLKSDKQGRSYDRWNTVHKWKNLEYSFWFGLMTISQNLADPIWCRIRRNEKYESDREFWDLSRKNKYTLIRPTVQELWSLKFGGGVSSGQIELSGQIWTLNPLTNGFLGNHEYQNPIEFCTLSNSGYNSEFWSRTKKLWPIEVEQYYKIWFSLPVNFQVFFVFFFTFVRLNGFQSPSYSCTCICNVMIYVGPICSSPKEKLCLIYIWRTYRRWQSHSSP
jgi:hypothetical protein